MGSSLTSSSRLYYPTFIFFFFYKFRQQRRCRAGQSKRAGGLTASGRTQASERAADSRLSSRLRLFLLQLTQHSSAGALGPRRRPPHDHLRARGTPAPLRPPSWGGLSRPLPAAFPAVFPSGSGLGRRIPLRQRQGSWQESRLASRPGQSHLPAACGPSGLGE